MKTLQIQFPDELVIAFRECRIKENRETDAGFFRFIIKSYLEHMGYTFTEASIVQNGRPTLEVPKQPLAQAVATYVAPTEPTAAWDEPPKWNE